MDSDINEVYIKYVVDKLFFHVFVRLFDDVVIGPSETLIL